MRFGKLCVIEYLGKYNTNTNKEKRHYYKCLCDCGNYVNVTRKNLTKGIANSCGCTRIEKLKEYTKQNLPQNIFIECSTYIKCFDNFGHVFYISKNQLNKLKSIYWYVSKEGYVIGYIDGKYIKLHRYILSDINNHINQVDHINGVRFDNRDSNLRACEKLENAKNLKIRTDNTSGVKGVCWDKKLQCWHSQIGYNNKCIHIGYYNTFEEAVKHRQEIERSLFKTFNRNLEEENIIRVKAIFDEMQYTKSNNQIINILNQNSDNDLFKNVLRFLLNPFKITGISNSKINKTITSNTYNNIDSLSDLLNYLSEHNTGTDIDILTVKKFIEKQDNLLHDFLIELVTKSLKCNCSATTANKVLGEEFIPVFNVMLGTPIDKCKIPEGTWFSISHKLNGSRCLYYKGDFYTRQGHKYTGLEHIKADIERLSNDKQNLVFDGELVRKNVDGQTDSANFQIGVGIANSKADTKEELKLVIFDMITVNDFEHGKSKLTYKDRKIEVEALRETINQLNLENISVVDMFYEGTDQSQIWKWLDYAERNDLEGVMLNLDTPYECKRTKNLIKVKKFFECDIKCIGIENGTGRNKNTLGALVCDYKGYSVNVGSGFSDEQRNFYYNNPNEVVGKIVTVKYKEETQNKNGGISIQFPVFQCVRFDKSEESYN